MRILCILFLMCSSQLAMAAWQLKQAASAANPVEIFTKPMASSNFLAFKAVYNVNYSAAQIVDLVLDSDNMCSWAYQCQRVSNFKSRGKNYTYIRIAGIWPVKARDVVVSYHVSQQQNFTLIDVLQVKNLLAPHPDYMRLKYFANQWRLYPQAASTRIELITAVDPGGNVPAWLVNLVAIEAPQSTLLKVQQQLASGKYGQPLTAVK